MKRIALDTNAYSALLKGNLGVADMARKAVDIGIPLPVLGEIHYGIFDGTKSVENVNKLQKFLSTDRVNVLDINENTALLFGEIATELKRVGKPMQQNDIWIAAVCKQYDYTLLSNDRGFSEIIGLKLMVFSYS